jgi:hypothetical protein
MNPKANPNRSRSKVKTKNAVILDGTTLFVNGKMVDRSLEGHSIVANSDGTYTISFATGDPIVATSLTGDNRRNWAEGTELVDTQFGGKRYIKSKGQAGVRLARKKGNGCEGVVQMDWNAFFASGYTLPQYAKNTGSDED